jgi:3-demethoxyubiquinol 3-hydroxylase
MNGGDLRTRTYSGVDRLIDRLDRFVRTVAPAEQVATRPSPARDLPDPPLPARERRHAAGLMRVNHTGEVCAQALYLAQALVARDAMLEQSLREAAVEEHDHLVWCAGRLRELDSYPSVLDPAWFAGSIAIALAAAAVGDAVSLGFVEETERQVCAHLDGHLAELSEHDVRSRAIVAAMRDDEARHADNARARGARELPSPIKRLMALQARVMTTLAYWI